VHALNNVRLRYYTKAEAPLTGYTGNVFSPQRLGVRMHPLPESRWLVAKMTRSAIHQADMAREAPRTNTTNTSINRMNTILPVGEHNHLSKIIARCQYRVRIL